MLVVCPVYLRYTKWAMTMGENIGPCIDGIEWGFVSSPAIAYTNLFKHKGGYISDYYDFDA